MVRIDFLPNHTDFTLTAVGHTTLSAIKTMLFNRNNLQLGTLIITTSHRTTPHPAPNLTQCHGSLTLHGASGSRTL